MDELTWGPSARLQRLQAPKTLADQALLEIRKDIISGRLKSTEKLQPEKLEQHYNIGRSPIREALSRLSAEGLVEGEGQRGFQVARTMREELLDVADLRIRFSTLALKRSISLGDDAWEAALVGAFHSLTKIESAMRSGDDAVADEWEKRNRQFHSALEAACGSAWLLHFCDILYDQSERYRRSFVRYPEINPVLNEQHQAIMNEALKRNDVLACALLEDHIRTGANATLKLMQG